MSIPPKPFKVFMAVIPSAPPCKQEKARKDMSVRLGDNLAHTGILDTFFTSSVICAHKSGISEIKLPIPLSGTPFGQLKFNSITSAPAF